MARTLGINVRVQEDAEEFYLRLLDAVDNSMMQLEKDDLEPISPPSSRFLVKMEQSIRYLHRNETRRKEQRFLDLSIDLPQSSEEVCLLKRVQSRNKFSICANLITSLFDWKKQWGEYLSLNSCPLESEQL